jgi:hypothetical protein
MAATRIAGTAFFKLDGAQYSIEGTLIVQPMSLMREGRTGLSGIVGFAEKPVIPYIEVEFTKTPELSMKAIERVANSTITGEGADGTVYVLRNAYFAGETTLDLGEGKSTVRFEGLECLETA